jgi:hypothetical protein
MKIAEKIVHLNLTNYKKHPVFYQLVYQGLEKIN